MNCAFTCQTDGRSPGTLFPCLDDSKLKSESESFNDSQHKRHLTAPDVEECWPLSWSYILLMSL